MSTPSYLLQRVKVEFARTWRELENMSGPQKGLLNIALRAPSTSREETYAWMGSIPAVEEFLSDAQIEQLSDYDFTIRNRDWVVPVHIRKSDYNDDKTGMAAQIGQLMAAELAKHPAELIEDLIIAGDSGTAYDGIAFFSDTSSPRVNDNLLTGTGTTLSQLATDLESVEAAMMSFVDDQGKYLNIVPDSIVCGPTLMNKFKRLVGSETDPTASAHGTLNPFYRRYAVYGSAKIGADDANDWYAFASGGVLKPFIWQTRENPSVAIEDNPTSPSYAIVGTSRGNVGYGLPHLAVKTTNT